MARMNKTSFRLVDMLSELAALNRELLSIGRIEDARTVATMIESGAFYLSTGYDHGNLFDTYRQTIDRIRAR